MTTPREPTARELQERLDAALAEVALLRWQLDAVTAAAAQLEAREAARAEEIEQVRTVTARRVRRLEPSQRERRAADWVGEQLERIERRTLARRR